MDWTNEQREAIKTQGNLIVSAAAGAGKTAVLTERVVSRVLAGCPIGGMLVLTFTRAAASEMKTRISDRLNAAADAEEDPERMRYLRRQARAADGAYISTVHAFCARVLRRQYHTVGLPAGSRVADEMESAALVETVKDALLTELSAAEDADYQALLAAFGGENAAWEAVQRTYEFSRALPEPDEWMTEAAARYGDDAALNGLLDDAVSYCKHELSLVIETVEAARDSLPPELAGVISVLDDDLSRYRALLLCCGYEEYRAALGGIEYLRMTFPRGTDESEKAPVQEAREMGKKLVKDQRARLTRNASESLEIMRRAGGAVSALVSVVRRFDRAYTEAKRGAGCMDYADLEHLTLAALKNESVAKEYRGRFELIAVDEYQDINRVQEAIVRRVSRGNNLFLVGDVKQSIYRFRQAEPALFLEKLMRFSGEAGRRVDLSRNFRSAREVLFAVNDAFGAVMSREAGELDYDERARLVCGGDPPPGGAELHLIRRGREEPENGEDALEDAADLEVESRLIAGRIHELIANEGYTDPGTKKTRSYGYRDFAVLLRAGTDAQTVAQTLSRCGVPCYAQSSGGYFDAVEVQILLNLLRVIDNRRQDVALLSVLCSSVGGFSLEELSRVRAAHRDGSFFEAFAACADGTDALGARAKAFLDRLEAYRAESRLVSVEELLGRLLDETGFYEEMGAGYGGAQRQANLDALLDKAHAFERGGARGVWNFLRQIDLAANTAAVGAAQTVTADVVRLLTIHKSKGLEFPVVFVAGLGKRFNLQDTFHSLLLHAEQGIALRFLDDAGAETPRLKRDTLARQILSRRLRVEQLGEEMRVLYVAMTRARCRLILTGCAFKPEEKLLRAQENPAAWAVLRAGTPLQWLLMGPRRALEISCYERETFLGAERAQTAAPLPEADPAVVAAIEKRLSWRYPHEEAVRLPAKAAVSGVGRETAELPALNVPAFLGRPKDGAFAGTATHQAMQYLPLDGSLDPGGVRDFLTRLADSGRLTPEQADAADARAIGWFLSTPLWARMRHAERLERELAFSCAMDASALGETDAHERILLQGVIDACFLENGAWTIVDYKTDRAREGESAAQAAERHRTQISLYAQSLESLGGAPVGERLIVLLSRRAVVPL